jgi:GEVED domain/Putative metal-binding motif/Secretion system C-terminal sorting domain/Fibronectin type III domain
VRTNRWLSTCLALVLFALPGLVSAQTYCTSGAQFADDGDISSVTLGTTSNGTACGVAASGAGSVAGKYSNFTSLTGATASQGSTLPFSVTMTSCTEFAFDYAVAIYVDFNIDGDFGDAGELAYTSATSEVSNTTPVTVTGVIAVPSDASLGISRVRVVMLEQPGAFSSCGTYTYGETEDHLLTLEGNGNCFSTPAPGATLTSNAAPVGLNSFILTLASPVGGAGVSYQWASSTNGTTFTPIAGAISTSLTTTTDVPTYYRCVVSCSFSGQSATSIAVLVTPAPLTLANYCAPPISSSSADEEIFGVTFGDIYQTSTCTTGSQYGNFTTGPCPAFFVAGQTYPLTLNLGMCGTFSFSGHAEVMIDYNRNGVFNLPAERVYSTPYGAPSPFAYPGQAFTTNITIPVTAANGNMLMRVLYYETATAYTGCAPAPSSWGDIEDYFITVAATVPVCSGTPTPGNTVAAVDSICPSTAFNVSLSNCPALGYSFQWEKSTNGIDYTAIVGGDDAVLVGATQSVATYYRCVVTCLASGLSATSTPDLVTQKGQFGCYCAAPAANSTFYHEIFGVTFGGISQFADCNSSPSQYSDYTNSIPCPTELTVGGSYPITLNLSTSCGFASALPGHAEVFIDFNRNGIFDMPAERAFRYPAAAGSSYPGSTLPFPGEAVSGTVMVPANASLGSTLMRVMYFYDFNTPNADFNPCTVPNINYGDTEDYIVSFIAGGAACAGTPQAGTAVASVTSICPATSFNVSLAVTGCPSSAYSYQWEVSTNGTNFTPISGATNSTLVGATLSVTSWYRVVTSCATTGLSATSVADMVLVNSQFACYCTSAASSTADEEIFYVGFGTIANASTCATLAPGAGSVQNMYSNYLDLPAAEVSAGQTIPLTLTLGQCGATAYTGHGEVMIDWNRNGAFDLPAERVYTSPTVAITPSGLTYSASVQVPANAVPGNTLMRVSVFETGAAFTGCGTPVSWGEVEDYMINITVPPPCTAAPAITIASAPAGYCVGFTNTLTLSATNVPNQSGLTYRWQSSVGGGAWTDISGATSFTYTASVSSDISYQLVTSCGALSATSNVLAIVGSTPPVAGVVTGPNTGQTSVPATFTVTGASSVQWQVATAGVSGPWFDVVGATGLTQGLVASVGVTYYLRVKSSTAGCTDVFSNVHSWIVTLSNDNVCGATTVNVGTSPTFSNAGSTVQTGEPFPPSGGCNTDSTWCSVPGSNSVWFKFTPTTNGSYTFAAPGFDSQIAVYTAASCGAILTGGATLIAANDDGGAGYSAVVAESCIQAGNTYYIQVDGYSTGTGNFQMVITLNAAAVIGGLPATACGQDPTAVAMTPATATFSGPGVSPGTNIFYPANAGDGTHTITATFGCFTMTKTIVVSSNSFYYDGDVDGFGDATNPSFPSLLGCASIAGYVMNDDDCNDGDAATNPNSAEICDGGDNNCNMTIDEGVTTTYYFDGDFDGFGLDATAVQACTPSAGFVATGGDCLDTDATVNPLGTELCNGLDDECNGVVDNGFPYATYYLDQDNDNFGLTSSATPYCQAPGTNWDLVGGDCDDQNPLANPGKLEVCNGIDDDCDGLVDGNDPSATGTATYYQDLDADGYGNILVTVSSCSAVPGYVLNKKDCNDNNALINPDGQEVAANLIDEDCDGLIDETCDAVNGLEVSNIQNFGATFSWNSVLSATKYRITYQRLGIAGTTVVTIPTATTTFNYPDLIPQTGYRWRTRAYCNGGWAALSQWDTFYTNIEVYVDADLDGYGSTTISFQPAYGPGYVDNSDDCDDTNAAINAVGVEVCDQVDNDCDGTIDEDFALLNLFADTDGDGFGDPNVFSLNCQVLPGNVEDYTDCDDTNAAINTAAVEACNDIDDNCDLVVDYCDQPLNLTYSNVGTASAIVSWVGSSCIQSYQLQYRIFYAGGSFGPFTTVTVPNTAVSYNMIGLESLLRYQVRLKAKCKDGSLTPFITTTFVTKDTIYVDADEDGFGDPNNWFLNDSLVEPGQSLSAGDCNDNDATIYTGANEVCDGVDNDCNGDIDGNVDICPKPVVTVTSYGLTNGLVSWTSSCADGYEVAISGDGGSTWSTPTVLGATATSYDFTGLTELTIYNVQVQAICTISESDLAPAMFTTRTTWYADADGDTFGNPAVTLVENAQPMGYILNNTDCNDAIATIFPGGTETCNVMDDDCDGTVDEGVQTVFYLDADADTYGTPNATTMACVVPAGYSVNSLDCNDANPLVPNLSVCGVPTATNETNITANSAKLNWTSSNCENDFLLQYRPQIQQTIAWTWVPLDNIAVNTYTATMLNANKVYLWRVRTICGANQSAQASDQFKTLVAGAGLEVINDNNNDATTFAIFPNPGRGLVSLVIPGEETKVSVISVKDQLGRVIMEMETEMTGNVPFTIDITDAPEGAYFINVTQGSEIRTQRYMKF